MKILIFYLLFFLGLIIFQISFLDILTPSPTLPLIILISLIHFSLLVPFPQVFYRTIPLSLLFDIITASPGIMTLYSILLVYIVGSFTKRFFVDNHISFSLFYIVIAFIGSIGFSLFSFFFFAEFFAREDKNLAFSLFLSSQHFLLTFLLCIPLFILLLYVVRSFTRYIQLIEDTVSKNIR